MRKNTGFWLLFGCVLITLSLWFLGKDLGDVFASQQMILMTVGQVMGLIGITLFGLNFILVTRIRLLEDLFGGIDKVYLAHHITGGLAFTFLLLHPMFLTLSYYLISPEFAFEFLLLPSYAMSVNWGKLALILMSVLLIITFYLNLPYHLWKLSHKFMGVAFFLASLHVLMVSGDMTVNQPLKAWIMIVLALGLVSYIYKVILGKSLLKKLDFVTKDVEKINSDIWEITLAPVGKSFTFIPGQFCFLEFANPEVGSESHPFSISSPITDQNLKFTIKDLGDFTHKIGSLSLGDKVKIEGPYGGFRFSTHYKKQIWIAGGIGITPFLSMLDSITADQEIDIYYSVKETSEFINLKELKSASEKNKNVRLFTWVSNKTGRLTIDDILKESPVLTDKIIYICGPQAMMTAMKQQLEKHKVKGSQIRMEEFELI